MISIVRSWFIVLKRFAARFRPGRLTRVVKALVEDNVRATTEDRGDVTRLQAKPSNRAPMGLSRQDLTLENDPVTGRYPASSVDKATRHRTNQDIDSTGFSSLEGYAEGLSVSEETISKWVNAGILSPQETEVAEKVIRIMRSKISDGGSPHSLSSPDPSPSRSE